MLTLTKNGDRTEIQIKLRRPLVYLDSCIISDIAGTKEGIQIRESLVEAGTLYISWAHIMEFFALGNGPTFQRIHEYLRSFGPHFLLIDSDVNGIAKREQKWIPGDQNPAIDEAFLRVAAANCHHDGIMSLGSLFETMRQEKDFFRGIKRIHNDYKQNITDMVNQHRHVYKNDKGMRRDLDGMKYNHVVSPRDLLTRIALELIRETIRTNEIFKATDALDFSHTVVSMSYCDFTVLDKKWARRCRGRALADLPEGVAASVYDGTEIKTFVVALQRYSPLSLSADI